MKRFRKYEFGSKAAASAKINALGLDEDSNPTHSHSIVRLGHLVVTEGTYDDDGNELTAPVLATNYSVDVMWDGEPNADWDNQMVWCAPIGVHTFGSSSAIREWTEKCKELHPEYFPEPEEDLI